MAKLDTSKIYEHLWQGSLPQRGTSVKDAGFDVLVLCAEEYQPLANSFPGVQVIHAPNIDNPYSHIQPCVWKTTIKAAVQVADAMREKKNVLVTCQAGLNRSGLVSCLALHFVTGMSGLECIQLVRNKRANAMFNPYFAAYVYHLPDTLNYLDEIPVHIHPSDVPSIRSNARKEDGKTFCLDCWSARDYVGICDLCGSELIEAKGN